MKKITSFSMLLLGLIMILLIIILCLTGVSWILISMPYGILRGIQNSDLSIKLFAISIILFFFFLTEKKGKVVLFNASMVFFLMGAAGKYLLLTREYYSPVVVTDSHGWNLFSDTLGFRHPKNFCDHSVCKSGDTLLYDVHYTTDENGFRKTPSIKFDKSTKGIVFFGCSFAFGQGLNDSLVMPNIVQNLVKNS
jgi:hypothetical protein